MLKCLTSKFKISLALELLDYCYRQDDDQAQQLLTVEMQNWSGQTCLSLAVAANHRALIAHPLSQIILADLWMGGLRTRKNTNIRVLITPRKNCQFLNNTLVLDFIRFVIPSIYITVGI